MCGGRNQQGTKSAALGADLIPVKPYWIFCACTRDVISMEHNRHGNGLTL